MHPILVSTLLFAALTLASPANDWSKPCFDGECAYDSPDPKVSAVFKLRGHPKSITDITPAAGWVILDCDPNTLEQDIRLVCQSHDESGCEHMFSYHGPEHKLVRLPESCGHGPFARIASAKVAEDQSIPGHMDHKVMKRDGVPPVVHIVTIDTNFAAVDMSKTGQIDMAYQAINIPNIDANFAFDDSHDFFEWLAKRFEELGNTISTGLEKVKDAVKGAAHWLSNTWTTVKDFVGNLPENLEKLTAFNISAEVVPTKNIDIKGNKSEILSILPAHCNKPFAVGLTVSLDGHATAQVTIGVVMKGSVVPLKIDLIHFAFDVNADIDTSISIVAHLHGTYQSKKITVFDLGIPMFSIPKVFALGPWIQLDLQAKAHLDIDFDSTLDLHYHVQHMRVWWPELDDAPKQQEMEMQNSKKPLSLSVDASVKANAIIEGHIIPSVRMGIKIADLAQASAFVEADAHARVSLAADANIHAQVKRDSKASGSYIPPYGHNFRDLIPRSTDGGVAASFTGCIWVTAGIAIAAGLHGSLGSFFAETKATIWKSQELDILAHCWQAGTEAKSLLKKPSFDFKESEANSAATCPTHNPASLSAVGISEGDKLKPQHHNLTGTAVEHGSVKTGSPA